MSAAEDMTTHKPDCLCAACDLERRVAAIPRKPFVAVAPPHDPEPPVDCLSTIASLAAAYGVPEAVGAVVHRCECGVEVAARGDLCAPCSERNSAAFRRVALAKAWGSLPSTWDHADLALGSRCPAHASLLKVAATWKRDDGNVVFLGKTGAGKSTAAVAGAKRILRRAEATALAVDDMAFAVHLRFMRARDLVADVKNHPYGSRTESPLFRMAAKASLLILDEIGFEPVDPTNGPIPRLLEARYDDATKRTWTTSGLTKVEFADRYGEANARKAGALDRGVLVEVF